MWRQPAVLFFFPLFFFPTTHAYSVAFCLARIVFLFHNIWSVTSNHCPFSELFSGLHMSTVPHLKKKYLLPLLAWWQLLNVRAKNIVRPGIMYGLFRVKTSGKRAMSFKKCIQNILQKKTRDLLLQQTRNDISPQSADFSPLLHKWDLIAPVRHGKLIYSLCAQRWWFLQTA